MTVCYFRRKVKVKKSALLSSRVLPFICTKEPCQDWEKEVKVKTKNNIVMQQHAVDKSGGLEAKILASASASNIWPRPGLDLVVLLCSGAFLGKNHVKFGNFVKFFR